MSLCQIIAVVGMWVNDIPNMQNERALDCKMKEPVEEQMQGRAFSESPLSS
jgi:hypothetical protein